MAEWREMVERRKEFRREIAQVSQSYSDADIFRDACRMFAISLRLPLVAGDVKDALEDEFKRYADRYGKEGVEHINKAFVILCNALEVHRGDFLGHVLEEYNATNKGFGQYLTPDPIARLMARITTGKPVPGELLRLNDPACGAGALLIEGAEEYISDGGRQGDVLIIASDLDYNAFNIAYVQFSLLGYAAEVTRMDALSNEVYEGPWKTVGYFAHGMPMRLLAERGKKAKIEGEVEQRNDSSSVSGLKSSAEASLSQGEFAF